MRRFCLSFFTAMTSALAADFPAPEALPAHSALPDPLVMRDGSRVTTKAGWQSRRAPELRALFSHYMYGARPPATRIAGSSSELCLAPRGRR